MRLFDPYTIGTRASAGVSFGGMFVPNRIVMAPMTRRRAYGGVISDWAVQHYSDRADAGLIISEATHVEPRGQTQADTPGLFTPEQVQAWRLVTDAVHARGGRIVAQLAHAGRLTHSDLHGLPPIAPSPLPPGGFVRTPSGTRMYEVPHSPPAEQVHTLIATFVHAARCAHKAGFDGVELHGAHGFLIDQFIQSGTNQRLDAYGGDAKGRRRFVLELFQAISSVWPLPRIGLTLSPGGNHKGIADENPVATFSDLARDLDGLGLGWIHLADLPIADVRPSTWMRTYFSGTILVSEGYTADTAEQVLAQGLADLVGFGRSFTANPDLVQRLRTGQALRLEDPATYYTGGKKGYVQD